MPLVGLKRRREVEHMQRLLDDREETIRDLRLRLDASEAERRGVQTQLTALLAAPTTRDRPAADEDELAQALADARAAERIAAGEAAALRAQADERHGWRLLRRLRWALRGE